LALAEREVPAITSQWRFFSKADFEEDRAPRSSHSPVEVNLRARLAALLTHRPLGYRLARSVPGHERPRSRERLVFGHHASVE
jgi:hypothetical protein